MITPPARVALMISSMQIFYLKYVVAMKAPKQLAVNAITVLPIIKLFSKGVLGKYPALKEGQNIHRNRVPIIANVLLNLLVCIFLICLPYFDLEMKKLTTSP